MYKLYHTHHLLVILSCSLPHASASFSLVTGSNPQDLVPTSSRFIRFLISFSFSVDFMLTYTFIACISLT
ncbi:hypothetical protein F5J12DRAFT_809421 [Pisolithus orientalis]|uniref:uncharacterized protein n=1 Tax=Pisolithus orientalis TaxID=936130 RepID=UPI0022259990|nr:uncharacterized protein F5J12DRAFT_809421 [Pisolithus orientalis]KAI6025627.1 hypothetical protein F5J12DRAFT_809421 [Pisolithus orientalis]